MPRYQRNLTRLRPVMSVKHVIDTNGAINAATQSITDIVNSSDNPPFTNPADCATGSTVHGVFLNVQVIAIVPAGGIDNIYMLIFKNEANNDTPPTINNVGASDKRRFVIHQEMLMTGSVGTVGSNAIPKTLFKGFIKFPPRMKRNGLDDKWQVVIAHRSGEATQQTNFCLQCIYKEFR